MEKVLIFILFSIFGLISFVGAWGFWWEPSRIVVRTEVLKVNDWPQNSRNLKIVVASDFHIGSLYWGKENAKKIVNKINSQNPDMVFLLGDYLISKVLFGRFVDPKSVAFAFGGIEAPLGVFSVLGNHDWWEGGSQLERGLQQAGITVLENELRTIEWDQNRLSVLGIADDISRKPNIRQILDRQAKTEHFTILMTHDPGVLLDLSTSDQFGLMLAGHTHGGGQIDLLFTNFHFLTPGRSPKEWAYGWVGTPNGSLYVTSGIGNSILPFRLNAPPEIVVFSVGHRFAH